MPYQYASAVSAHPPLLHDHGILKPNTHKPTL